MGRHISAKQKLRRSPTWFVQCLYNVQSNINSDVREKRAVEGASPYIFLTHKTGRLLHRPVIFISVLVSKSKIYLARVYICVQHLYPDRVAHTIFHAVCEVFQAHHIVADIFAVRHIVRMEKPLAGIRETDRPQRLRPQFPLIPRRYGRSYTQPCSNPHSFAQPALL